MKKILILLLLFISAGAFAQNASTYFPSSLGYKWFYKNTPLDSLNNPMTNLATYRIDSFAVVQNYNGKLANVVRKKDFLTAFNQERPYNDTAFYNFDGTNGWEFLFANVDTTIIPFPGIGNFLVGLRNWYSVFRFAQAVNSEYTLVQKDTTISFDTISAPLRFKYKAKRLNDETVNTVNGTYENAKRFVTTTALYIRVVIFEIPIIERPDTTWFASGVWMIKRVTPSVNVDLSGLGIPLSFSVPGNKYELENPATGIQNVSSETPSSFSMQQNYPNPFNPVTNIKFSIPKSSNVRIAVYDISGKEVDVLVNDNVNAGTYQVSWNAERFSSGTYFCRMSSNGFTETKRMTLIK